MWVDSPGLLNGPSFKKCTIWLVTTKVLTSVATACGCENVVECSAEETPAAVQAALDGNKMTIIVSKCESGNIKVPVIEMDPVVIRDRFMKQVEARNS